MCLCVYSVNLILKTIYVTAVHTHTQRERPVTAVPLIKCRGVLLLLFFVCIYSQSNTIILPVVFQFHCVYVCGHVCTCACKFN